MTSQLTKLVGFQICLGILTGCGTQSTPATTQVSESATACGTGMAKIMVLQGMMKILCGCTGANEANGTYVVAPTLLTCHLGAGAKTVFFNFSGSVVKNQIVPSGTQLFTATPISDPINSNGLFEYPVYLPNAQTTYSFINSFNNAMSGQIVVQ